MELDIAKILQTQFYTLPLVVQDAINEGGWRQEIQKIGSDFRLHKDQITSIESATLLTVLGFADVADFSKNVVTEAKIDTNTANEFSKRINSSIFKKFEDLALGALSEKKALLNYDESLNVLDEARFRDIDTEGVDDLDMTNAQDVAAKKLLDEIENPELFQNRDTTTDKAETHLQNHVDTMIQGGEEVKEGAASPVQKKETLEEKRPATHMRTLKSDIIKEKLENPSWAPKIDAETDPIAKEALRSIPPKKQLNQ